MTQYIHPHVETNIIDDSFAFITSEGLTTLFVAFTADKGVDRKLVNLTSQSEFISNFGDPNIARHGQAQLNAFRWVGAGGRAYALRVTDEDASYAHAVVEIRTKIEETVDDLSGDTVRSLQVKTAVTSVAETQAVDVSSARLALSLELAASDIDADGFKRYPIAFINAPGRGSFYNNTGFRLYIDDSADDSFDYRIYNFEIVERKSNGALRLLDSPFAVSMSPEALNPLDRSAMSLEEVTKLYTKNLKVDLDTDQLDNLDRDLGVNIDLVDLMTGTNRIIQGQEQASVFDEAGYDSVEWVETGVDYQDFAGIVFLKGGNDGDTSLANVDFLLSRAYTGAITPEITDKDWTDLDIMLDANYSDSVKDAMVFMARDVRQDCMTILDTGFTGDYTQAIAKRRDTLTYDTHHVAIFTQDMILDDIFTRREVRVTPTYILAHKIPSNDASNGTHRPFAGPRRGGVNGVKDYSWFPTDPQKTDLYKAQLNYIERTPKRTNFGTQLTSQARNSDLSNISVARTLYKIIRRMRLVAQEFPMEFNNTDTEDALLLELRGIGNEYIANAACELVKPRIITTEYERRRKIMHVAIELKFTGLIERIIMDFVVTK